MRHWFGKAGECMERDCCFELDGFWFRYRAAAIIIEDGCVLMAYNSGEDYYYSVGGGVHLGEASRDAVIREVKEETGIEYEVERFAFVNESMYHGNGNLAGKECHVVEFFYLMKPKGRKFALGNHGGMADESGERLKWLPLEDAKNNPKVFPIIFREGLSGLPGEIMHFIRDER